MLARTGGANSCSSATMGSRETSSSPRCTRSASLAASVPKEQPARSSKHFSTVCVHCKTTKSVTFKRYPGLCNGQPSEPLTVRPPLWPWELPEGFPTSAPLDPNKPLITGFVDLSGNPDAVVDPPDVVSPPTIVPDDRCVYTCRANRGCSVKIVTNRAIDGSVMGSCFPPSFGGSCSGIPQRCQDCSIKCVGNYGNKITVKLDKEGALLVQKPITRFQNQFQYYGQYECNSQCQ